MSENPFLHDLPKAHKGKSKIFVDILQVIVVIMAMFVVSYLFLVIPNQVDGESMMPNFQDNELLFTNKIVQLIGDTSLSQKYNYDYSHGDVVIFQKPGHDDFIKRVIGVPGDEVMIQQNTVYLNGRAMKETYIPDDFVTRTYSFMSDGETKIVPEGHYFLMGDNRSNSKDSRFSDIGFVSREHIKGRVFIRYWPIDTFSLITAGEVIYE